MKQVASWVLVLALVLIAVAAVVLMMLLYDPEPRTIVDAISIDRP